MISRNGVNRIGASAPNLSCSLYWAKLAVWLVVGCFSAGNLFAATPIAKVYRWDSQIEDGTAYLLSPTRGESMVLQIRALSYGQPMDLTHAYTVYMIYKAVGSTNTYNISGAITDPTNGQFQVDWTAANEFSASTYAYDILISGPTSTVVAARGAIKFRDGVSTGAQLSTNAPIYILDFAQVQLLNVGHAPFLSSYEITDIRNYLEAIQAGLGDIDARDVTVRGTLNYTNWPGYLARTNQIPMQSTVAAGANITVATTTNAGRIVYTVTGAASGGGSSGGGIGSYTNTAINGVANTNHIDIIDGAGTYWAVSTDNVWTVNVSTSLSFAALQGQTAYGWGDHHAMGYLTSIPGDWVTTGTNAWVINGQTVGYVTTNGIRLLNGTLTLDNYDLDCNVRLYDGSWTTPSLTPQGHPGTWGLFFRGYNSSYSAAWSQGGLEIGVLSGLGINLSTTNAAFTGRHVGDMSGGTGYPEPIATNWLNTRMLPDITITNSGSITVKDAGGTTRFSVNGSSGATSIRAQDSDLRYALAPTNMTAFAITNVFPTGVTNVYKFTAQGICTNHP